MLPATVRTGTCVALLLAGMALAAVTARTVGPLHAPLRSDSGHDREHYWGPNWGHYWGPPPPPPMASMGTGLPPAPPPALPADGSHGTPPPPPPTAEQRSIIRNIRAAFAARFAALHQEHYAAWVALEAALTRATPDPEETARNAVALRDVAAKQQDLAIEMRQRIIRETGIRTPLPGHLPPPPSGMAEFTAPPPRRGYAADMPADAASGPDSATGICPPPATLRNTPPPRPAPPPA